jgi:hypothetical protein
LPAPLFGNALGDFADELTAALERAGELALARKVAGLPILDHDRSADAVAIYTEPRPADSYGSDHRIVQLGIRRGMAVLDVVGDRIVCVEVLGRGDLRARLRELSE